MDNNSSFDRLVLGISPEERKKILSQVSAVDNDSESLSSESINEGIEVLTDVEIFRDESLLVKIWLWIKALVTNNRVDTLYNEFRLKELAKKIQKNYPDLIDRRNSQLKNMFHEKLQQLKLAADFFKPYVDAADSDYGSFIVFAGSLLMPSTSEKMEEEVDPFSNKISAGAKPELRSLLLKQMDEIIASIPDDEKNAMYEGIRCIEWINQFTRLPFTKFLLSFGDVGNNSYACGFGAVDSEFAAFARVLCNGVKMPSKAIETLYLYSKNFDQSSMNESSSDIPENVVSSDEDFIVKMKNQIAMIRMFITSIPIHSIGCIVFSDSKWQSPSLSGGEDWFVRYKAECKKVFDRKWEAWGMACRKEGLRQILEQNFDIEKFPLLPERPWVGMWGGLNFVYELTAGFIYWFDIQKFLTIEPVLKTIMVEGIFVKKENRLSFTDVYNDFVQNSIAIKDLNVKLRPNGDIGSVINKIKNERVKTLVSKTKAEQIIHNVEEDFRGILGDFGNCCRMMSLLLNGILGMSTDTRYESISNLGLLRGTEDKDFLSLVNEARMNIESALNLVKELEAVDTHR